MSNLTKDSDDPYRDCVDFLNHEAELLDNNELMNWFNLICEDINYRIPVRTTRERSAESDFSSTSYHMKEDWSSLKARVERLETEYDWSEDPPSRTRRFISNIRIDDVSESEVNLKNNLLVYRSQGDTTSYDIISGERQDTLKIGQNGYCLKERLVLLDQTILNLESSQSLSIFL